MAVFGSRQEGHIGVKMALVFRVLESTLVLEGVSKIDL